VRRIKGQNPGGGKGHTNLAQRALGTVKIQLRGKDGSTHRRQKPKQTYRRNWTENSVVEEAIKRKEKIQSKRKIGQRLMGGEWLFRGLLKEGKVVGGKKRTTSLT